MILGIQGSKEFNDYSVFLYGMALALKKMDSLDLQDKEFTIFSFGPNRVKDMGMEFLNVSDFKSRGIKTKIVNLPESWGKTNHELFNMFLYFCNEKQPFSELSKFLDKKEVDVQAMRYRVVKQ